MKVNENKIFDTLKMIPKISLFSNTDLFLNKKDNFTDGKKMIMKGMTTSVLLNLYYV